ncbi:hypothetical protein BASA81_001205 [Batrachochytrium salamandrivorans]|nr:hypothetical protein BASA81_001205 [Batrachochytrium salamandrivorans]
MLPLAGLLLLLWGTELSHSTMFPDLEHTPFELGVASGEPTFNSVVLWTKLFVSSSPVLESTSVVGWSIWDNQDFASAPIQQGEVNTTLTNEHSLSLLVGNLQPNTYYYYRFTHVGSGNTSVGGRTRTAPDSQDPSLIRIATVSCSSIWSGHMNSYHQLAELEDLNLVAHLGDFIYPELDRFSCRRVPEFADKSCPQECASQRVINPNTTFLASSRNCTGNKLNQFRWVYEYYLLDPLLRRMRQMHPMVVLFDNHDVGSSISQNVSAPEIRAFLEFVPLLVSNDTERFYRQLRFGKLVNLMALDTRNIGRPRSYLGDNQTAWVNSTLLGDDATWRLLLTTTAFAPWVLNGWESFVHFFFGVLLFLVCLSAGYCALAVSHVTAVGYEPVVSLDGSVVEDQAVKPARRSCCNWRKCSTACCVVAILIVVGVWAACFAVITSMAKARNVSLAPQPGQVFVNADYGVRTWSGNGNDRLLFLNQLESTDHSVNNVFVSGDLHMSMAGNVRRVDPADFTSLAQGKRLGVEVLSSSVSRSNIDEIVRYYGVPSGLIPFASLLATRVLLQVNPHFEYFEPTEHGYAVLEFAPDTITAEFWHTPTAVESTQQWLASKLVCYSGENMWRQM